MKKALKPLTPNAGVISWYRKQLKKHIKKIRRVIEKLAIEFYERHRTDAVLDAGIDFDDFLSDADIDSMDGLTQVTQEMAYDLLQRIDRSMKGQDIEGQLSDALKDSDLIEIEIKKSKKDFMLGGSPLGIENEEELRERIDYNAGLIRSLDKNYIGKVRDIVFEMIRDGKPRSELEKAVNAMGAKSERHAELLAEDQTRKACLSLNLQKMERLEIKKFRWLHSGGTMHPREYHRNDLNGKIFDIDDPPIIDERTGERGYPGQLPNCHCTMQPVIEFES